MEGVATHHEAPFYEVCIQHVDHGACFIKCTMYIQTFECNFDASLHLWEVLNI